MSNRSRLHIGRELAKLPLAGNYCHCFSLRTASDAVHFYLGGGGGGGGKFRVLTNSPKSSNLILISYFDCEIVR